MTIEEIFTWVRASAADRRRGTTAEIIWRAMYNVTTGPIAVAQHDIPDKWMRDDRSKDALCASLTRLMSDAGGVIDGYVFVHECWVSTRPIDQPDDAAPTRPSADPERTEALFAVCETKTKSELWLLKLCRDAAGCVQLDGDWVRVDGYSRFAYMLCPPPARS